MVTPADSAVQSITGVFVNMIQLAGSVLAPPCAVQSSQRP
jgi:hypothetical protein